MTSVFPTLLNAHDDLLQRLGIGAPERVRLVRFLDELWAANREINLVSRKLTPRQLVEGHLLDSLIGLPHLPRLTRVADLGSGGGFPAIPLAVCRPQTHFELFEKSVLKGRFLAKLQDWCPNVRVRGMLEAGGLAPETELVIARAFKPLKTLLELTDDYRRRGGRYLLYKGRRARILEELTAAGLAEKDVRLLLLEATGEADERYLVALGGSANS